MKKLMVLLFIVAACSTIEQKNNEKPNPFNEQTNIGNFR